MKESSESNADKLPQIDARHSHEEGNEKKLKKKSVLTFEYLHLCIL